MTDRHEADDPPFLTVSEVAGRLRVSTMTVYRLINAGQLPAVRVGRSFRLRPRDLDGYLAGPAVRTVRDHPTAPVNPVG